MSEETANIKESLTWRALWLLVAKTLGYVCSFALPLLLVRRLSVAEFGLYKQAFLVVNSAVAWLPMGFMMSAYYFLPREDQAGQQAAVTNILLFYYTLGAFIWAALAWGPQLLTYIIRGGGGVSLMPYSSLIGLTVLFWVGSSFLEVVALARQETRLATIFIVNAQLTKTLSLLAAAVWFGSVRALLVAAVCQGALQALVLQWYLGARWGSYWRHYDFGLLKRQLSYALPIGAGGILYYALLDLHNYFVSAYFSPDDFAVYALGSFTLPLAGIIATSVSAVMIPSVSRLQKDEAPREILNLTARATRKMLALYLPLYFFFLVAGHEVIEIMFRAQYLGTLPVLLINITLIPFLAFSGDAILRAYPQHRFFMLKARLYLLPLLCLGLWWGTTGYGLKGAAVVAVAFLILDRLVETVKAWVIVGGTWRDVRLLAGCLKFLVAAGGAGLSAFLVRLALAGVKPFPKMLITGLALSVAYAAGLLLLDALEPSEKDLVRSYWQRAVNLARRRKPVISW